MFDQIHQLRYSILIPALISGAIRAGTPLLLAASGEMLGESSGVINIGIEGIMLLGAMVAVGASVYSGSILIGVLAAVLVCSMFGLIHSLIVTYLKGNQIVSGFAIYFLCGGIASFGGRALVGIKIPEVPIIPIPYLDKLPENWSAVIFLDPFVLSAPIIALILAYIIYKTRAGILIRAVGENPYKAKAIGLNTNAIRIWCTTVGSGLIGLAGAQLSLSYAKLWADDMSGGRGWLALGLVAFAMWNPRRLILGSYIFGAILILPIILQAMGMTMSSHILAIIPYVLAILALAYSGISRRNNSWKVPRSLGKILE